MKFGGYKLQGSKLTDLYLQSISPVGSFPLMKSLSDTQSRMLSRVLVSRSKSLKL